MVVLDRGDLNGRKVVQEGEKVRLGGVSEY